MVCVYLTDMSQVISLPPGGRGPGLVVLSEPPGVNANVRAVCDWYAARGFVSISPDLSRTSDIHEAVAAFELVRTHEACTGRVGVVGFGVCGKLACLLASHHHLDAVVTYDYTPDAANDLSCPLLVHVTTDDPAAAELADLRTVDFLLRTLIVKTHPLEAIWSAHVECEFASRDTEATLATMVEDAYVNHIPVLTGGVGLLALREFYSKHFIPQMPPDTKLTPLSRTIGDKQIVDEMIFEFTHTIRMDWMLPGVEPTGRHVAVPLVAIVNFRGDKLAHEHIYWDQASVLVQLGLLDCSKLPIAGVESARKAADPSLSARQLP
jgi:carboxymethylenebutenolidase